MKLLLQIRLFIGIFVSLSLPILWGCETKSTYKYESGVIRFIDDNFPLINLKNKNPQFIYFFPLNNCDPCINSNFIFIEELNSMGFNDFILVFSGLDELSFTQKFSKNLLNQTNYFFDPNWKIREYETGISKPYIFQIDNGNIVEYFEMSELNIPSVLKYFTTEVIK